MKLSGKEMRLIPGAIMVYLSVPLHHAMRDATIIRSDTALLEKLDNRLHEACQTVYRPLLREGMAWPEMVEVFMKASLDFEFTGPEREAVARALEACAVELAADPEADVNINFGGEYYGIVREDFVNMRRRILEEE